MNRILQLDTFPTAQTHLRGLRARRIVQVLVTLLGLRHWAGLRLEIGGSAPGYRRRQ